MQTASFDPSRTEVFAPTDGYVTNLNVRVGDFASTGAPTMALIDSHSFWINGCTSRSTKLRTRSRGRRG